MRTFDITYAITGGITVEAETEEQARAIFDTYTQTQLYEDASPAEITDIIEIVDD